MANYSVASYPTDAADVLELTAVGDVLAVSAPADALATVELDGGDPIPLHVWPCVRLLCGKVDRAVIRWQAVADGTLYVFSGSDVDLGMIPQS